MCSVHIYVQCTFYTVYYTLIHILQYTIHSVQCTLTTHLATNAYIAYTI